MEEVITPTVLWSWLVGCGIWAWSHYQQSRWDSSLPMQPKAGRARQIRRGLFGLLLAALGVISLYWPGLLTRSWLLPIPALDHPLLNSAGLFVIRLAVCWLVIATIHRERVHASIWRQLDILSGRYWPRDPYHNRQIALAVGGLLLGLFMALSGVITAALCLVGWWLGWQLWQTYKPV